MGLMHKLAKLARAEPGSARGINEPKRPTRLGLQTCRIEPVLGSSRTTSSGTTPNPKALSGAMTRKDTHHVSNGYFRTAI